MYYFIEIACVIAEMWIVHTFLGCYYNAKDVSPYRRLWAYGLFGAINAVFSLLPNMALARLAVTCLGVWASGMLLFRTKILQSALSAIAFCSIVTVNDVISTVGFQICGVSSEALMGNHPARAVLLIVAHIFLFGILMLLCIISRKSNTTISAKVLLPVLPCWIISILLGFVYTRQCIVMGNEWHPLFLVVLIGLLYTNIIMIYFIKQSSEQAQVKKDLELAQHHYAMQQAYYDQLHAQQEETRALRHDISKYLRAAQVDASEDALTEVRKRLDSVSQIIDVNNPVVSMILNEYFQIAKNAHISMELDVLIPAKLFVTAADLYILLGNTLDNAIEACKSLPKEQRHIFLKLKKHNHMLYYEITNPYDEKHLHRPRSIYHGYGLKNVAKCVEKYHGKMNISKSGSVFKVSAHMNHLQ